MNRVQRDIAIHVCILLASIVLLWWAIPAYTPPYPGYGASPALVPNVAAGIMAFMAVLALVRHGIVYWLGRARNAQDTDYPEETSGFSQVGQIRLWHVIRLIIPCVLVTPAMKWFGFIPAAIAFILVIQYLIGERKPIRAVVVAVAVVLAVYVSLRYGFQVPVPGTAYRLPEIFHSFIPGA